MLDKLINLDEILIFAQPIVALDGQIKNCHFEILSRFLNHQGDMVYPDVVFDKSRTSMELRLLDRMIFEKAFARLASIQSVLGSYIATINVSEPSIEDGESFLGYVVELSNRYAIPPECIYLELTEKGDRGISDFVIKALEYDFNIAVDDFGSENFTISKLRYQVLRKLPSNMLSRIKVKIDQSFVINLFNNEVMDRAIDESFIEMALVVKKTYPGIQLVAEGIENRQVLRYLKSKGCSHGQGYYWAKPFLLTNEYTQPDLGL